MLSSVDYLSAGWPATLPVPPAGDLESRAVLALIPRIREAADRALAQAGLVSSDPNLSARGVWQQKARIGEAALAEINGLAAAEAMRESLAARIAKTPAPTLADVPPALVAPVLTALAALDPLERTASLRQWVQAGDTVAAVVAINAPQPFALVSAVERAELTDLLRRHRYGDNTAAAGALADALAALDRAAEAAVAMLRAALAMGDTAPDQVDYAPPSAPDPLQRAARGGSPDGVMR